jgi:5-formyltetrahydrofolate cyclo-ligase
MLKLLLSYTSGISYKPTKIEVSPLEIFPETSASIVYTIQPVATLNPAEEVRNAQLKTIDTPTFIFIPGTRFDATGTRHGKGAGWYDRFLSMAPKEWLRIGLCYPYQFSQGPLLRQSWDEPMDFICVVNEDSREFKYTETHARFPATS